MRRITVSPWAQLNALFAPVRRSQTARLCFMGFLAHEEPPSSHASRSRRPLWTGIFLLLIAFAIKPIPIAVDVMKPPELDLGPVRNLAVSDFQGTGGLALSSKLVTSLFERRRFEILERSHLARILDELALSQSGIMDETTAAKVGKAAGVDAPIFGEVDAYQIEDEKTVVPAVLHESTTG